MPPTTRFPFFSFTFHYVSILIPAVFSFEHICNTFTFHYVSILIVQFIQFLHLGSYLYIPLCLYFNRSKREQREHCAVLYIPLCLYFNLRESARHSSSSALYIPLCLYFNFPHHTAANFSVHFTFHYVSILIMQILMTKN